MKYTEADLFEPLEGYLKEQGYYVNAEVGACDVVAQKGEETIIIEMKKSFNLKLVYQLVERLKSFDGVYAAIGCTYKDTRSRKWKQMIDVCKRLEVGLIAIQHMKHGWRVRVELHPEQRQRRTNNRKKSHILREISNRSDNYNVGGRKGKQMTAYREAAIFIACLLQRDGALTVKQVRTITGIDNAQSILNLNHYGWFDKVKRGTYDLHPVGLEALNKWESVASYYKGILEKMNVAKEENVEA